MMRFFSVSVLATLDILLGLTPGQYLVILL